MQKYFKLANIAFYILMFIVFFFVGVYVAGILGAGKNQMLAGGAIVLGWGVLFAGIAFIVSFFIVHYIEHPVIVRLNWILLVLLLILYGITHYRYIERQKEENKKNMGIADKEMNETKPISAESAILHNNQTSLQDGDEKLELTTVQTSESKMGIGLFFPEFDKHPILYFYGNVNLEKIIDDHTALDSVVFTKDKHNNPTTSYAPPWLYPEHLKLDYGYISFKVLGVGRNFIKAEGNKRTNQIIYLDKNQGKFMSWSEFLLTVNSVEFDDNSLKKVFVKPLDYAGEVKAEFEFMQVQLVEDDWMYVRLVDGSLNEKGKGWIRWKKDNVMLITYSLLS